MPDYLLTFYIQFAVWLGLVYVIFKYFDRRMK